ncbi:hypothetical protein [Bacillus phage YungSlug]|nr:hypothetical protein [Bacillus phage YungSlug]
MSNQPFLLQIFWPPNPILRLKTVGGFYVNKREGKKNRWYNVVNLPDYVVEWKVIKRAESCSDHIFCAYCGKEISVFDFSNGRLWHRKHILGHTEDGVPVRLCMRRDLCVQKRNSKAKGDRDGKS